LIVRPTTTPGLWAVLNRGTSTAWNVAITADTDGAEVMDAGFWEQFPPSTVGTVYLQKSPRAMRFERGSDFVIQWQDAHAKSDATSFTIPAGVPGFTPLDLGEIPAGKLRPVTDILGASE